MSQTLVLSVGSDPFILDARDFILRSAGYIVVSAMSIEEAVHLFRDGDFDVIVLCHSLPMKDCERLTCLIRASGSQIPILSVSSGAAAGRNAFADATLDRAPGSFLRSLEEMMSRHARMHPVGAGNRHEHDGVNRPKDPSESSNGFDRHEREIQFHEGTLSFVEHPRGRVQPH